MHFSVMIFGDDVERQLAPFQECNIGPIAPEYHGESRCHRRVQEQFQARRRYGRLGDGRYVELGQAHHLWQDGSALRSSRGRAKCGRGTRTHRLGYATMDDAAEDIGAKREGDRFAIEDNPNSRWDHWTVGGRWGSTLKLLPGRQGYSAMPIEFDPEFAKVLNRPPPEIWQPTAYCDQSIGWVWRPLHAGLP